MIHWPGIYATPFSTGWLLIWDSLRVFVIVGGLALMFAVLLMTLRTRLLARIALASALLAFLVSAIGTEIEHLGDYATYRLFFNLAGVVIGGFGTWLARREP